MNLFRAITSSIRRKLMLVVLATTFAALSVASLVLIIVDLDRYQDIAVENVTTQAEILARATGPALAFNDVKSAAEDLQLLRVRPQIRAAAIYTRDGRVFASFAQGDEAAVPAAPLGPGYRVEDGRLRLFHPIVEQGEVIGTLFISSEYRAVERLATFLRIILAVMAVSALIALGVSAWLQARLTQPILEIADVARQVVEKGDYDLKARRTTNDEIGVLVDAFNAMLTEVGRREGELEAVDRRKDEFLATLAHELRNPLAPLSNALQILRVSPDDATKGKARDIMERQLSQMVRLVDDLLDVSRITTGKLGVKIERIELAPVIRNAVDTANPMMSAKRHEFTVDMPAGTVVLDGDATRLAQVFSNLLNNAARYTPEGGRIALQGHVDGEEVVVVVSDNGIGIAPDILPTIFEMFTQADRSLERTSAGLGVGLSLALRLVELHGGRIVATSEGLGKGSAFTVRLPIVAATVRLAGPSAPGRKPGASGNARRILLVDDNDDYASSMATLLRTMGNEVHVATDGVAALASAQAFRPEFAFLDIGMPGMNGYDLAKRLRDSFGESLVLTAVTGWGQDKDKQTARDAGFNFHLVKPVQVDSIQAILEGEAVAR